MVQDERADFKQHRLFKPEMNHRPPSKRNRNGARQLHGKVGESYLDLRWPLFVIVPRCTEAGPSSRGLHREVVTGQGPNTGLTKTRARSRGYLLEEKLHVAREIASKLFETF